MLDAAAVGRYTRTFDAVHSLAYFTREAEQAYVEAGLEPGRMCYFAGRSAALGPVAPNVVAAMFYTVNPELIARFVPRCWELCPPPAVIAARYRGVDATLRQALGPELITSAELAEAAELAAVAARAARPEGRPLFAGHAAVDWPSDPHLVLWHALTLLREHRGDGHIAALVTAGLSGIEALITHTVTGKGFTLEFARDRRGWSQQQWDDAATALRDRGLLDHDAGLTEDGIEIRQAVEDLTDESALEPWNTLGDDGFRRLTELLRPIHTALITRFPREFFGPEWSAAAWPEQ